MKHAFTTRVYRDIDETAPAARRFMARLFFIEHHAATDKREAYREQSPIMSFYGETADDAREKAVSWIRAEQDKERRQAETRAVMAAARRKTGEAA